MKKNRVTQIIHILLKENDFLTISQIAEILDVSNKTIRNDLDEVEEKLRSSNIELIRKTGAGIRINADENTKLHLRNSLAHQGEQFSYTKEERLNYLGLKLLLLQQIGVSETAEELYVSRASIHKDLNELSESFGKKKLKLIRQQNRNVTLQGSEKNIRKTMNDLLLRNNGYAEFLNIIRQPDQEPDGKMIFEALDLNDDEIFEFVHVIMNSRSPYIAILDLEELSQILTMILIMYLRIREGKVISLTDRFIEELNLKLFYPESRYLLDHMQNFYRIEIPNIEARYLQVFLLSLHNNRNIEKESDLIAKELISFWSSKLGTSLNEDEILYSGITNYLSSALTRMKHGINIDYPLMSDINTLYPNTYHIVDLSSSILRKHLSCDILDEEKGILTIYLAAALERKKKPLQTALISTSGEGATQLLSAKIHHSFPEIDLIRTFNYATLNQFRLEEFDLVLTTEKLSKADRHIIQINPVLYPEDLVRLKQIIKEFDSEKNDPSKNGIVD